MGNDDYYDDDGYYSNYVRTTQDAGPWLFWSVVAIVISLFLSIFPLVWMGRKWKKFRKARKRARAFAKAANQEKERSEHMEHGYEAMSDEPNAGMSKIPIESVITECAKDQSPTLMPLEQVTDNASFNQAKQAPPRQVKGSRMYDSSKETDGGDVTHNDFIDPAGTERLKELTTTLSSPLSDQLSAESTNDQWTATSSLDHVTNEVIFNQSEVPSREDKGDVMNRDQPMRDGNDSIQAADETTIVYHELTDPTDTEMRMEHKATSHASDRQGTASPVKAGAGGDADRVNMELLEIQQRDLQDDIILSTVDKILDPFVFEDDQLQKTETISHFDEDGVPGTNQIDLFETSILDQRACVPQKGRAAPGRKVRAAPVVLSDTDVNDDDTGDMPDNGPEGTRGADYTLEESSEDSSDDEGKEGETEFDLFMRETTRGWETLKAVLSLDRETKKIFRLAAPATFSAISSAAMDAITTALIAQNAGTEAFAAYSMVGVFLGLTDSLTSGVAEAEGVLTAQAIGMDNGFLAGQYAQLSLVLYLIGAVPMYTMWTFFADKAVLAFGMDETVAMLTREYIPIAVFSYMGGGIASGLGTLMWSADHGGFMTAVDTVFSVLYVVAIAAACAAFDHLALTTIAWIGIGYSILYGSFVFSATKRRGMLDPYWKGLFKRFALKNFNLVKGVVKMALPLSFGTLMSTGEWEILTFFAARMGGAEVAAWYIAGAIWSVFEYAPGGIGTAAEIRIGYHLGNGNPRMAKLAAYKSLLYSGLWSALITVIFSVFSRNIIGLFTSDPTLIYLLEECVPLMAIGNVLCCLGNDAYSVISAQSRPKLCTKVYLVFTWCVVLPLSGYLVFYRNFGLPALIASVVVSYGTIAVCFLYVVFTSNWSKLSKKVIAKANEMEGDEESKCVGKQDVLV